MSWHGLVRAAGLLLALLPASVCAAPFVDPPNKPSFLTPMAQSSRLTAVTQAGDRLVAVGPMGHILISGDRGAKWQQVQAPVSSDLVAVRFVHSEKGWSVGHDGVVLHTADGGRTWVKQLDGPQTAKVMRAVYEKRAAAGDTAAAEILAKEDGFVRWADKALFDVLFLNENEGFAVGAFNLALRTRDGGKTWEPLNERTENPKELHLYALTAAGGELYLTGELGMIRRWNSHDERFETVDSPYKGSFFGAVAKGKVLIAFGMRGNALRSTDGGKTWSKLETGTNGGITAGSVLTDGRIALVTQSGQLLLSNDEGATFSHTPTSKPAPYFGVAPAGPDRVVLTGTSGVRVESIK